MPNSKSLCRKPPLEKPVKVRMARHLAGEWFQAAPNDRSAETVMLVPIGEWTLMKREAKMFRDLARELSGPNRGRITGLSPAAADLVKRRAAAPKRQSELGVGRKGRA